MSSLICPVYSFAVDIFTLFQWDSLLVLTLICLSRDLMATPAFRNDGSRPDQSLVALCMLTVIMEMGGFSLPSLHFLKINVPGCCCLKRTLIFGAIFEFQDDQYLFKLLYHLCPALKANAGVFLALPILP